MRELAILRREKEGGEVDVTSLGSTPWTEWTKAKWQCGTSEGHYFLSKRLLMLQFMTRAATAKLRADRHLCVHTTDSTRATCTLVDISTAEFRDKCFQRSVWNSLVYVKGKAHSSGDYFCRGEAVWRAREAAGGGSKHIWSCFSYLPCSLSMLFLPFISQKKSQVFLFACRLRINSSSFTYYCNT